MDTCKNLQVILNWRHVRDEISLCYECKFAKRLIIEWAALSEMYRVKSLEHSNRFGYPGQRAEIAILPSGVSRQRYMHAIHSDM